MKYLFAIAAALGLAFAAYGAAASLNVNGGTIQAGADNAVTCTSSAVVNGWGYEADDDSVSAVRIYVANDCAGNDIIVRITGTGAGFPVNIPSTVLPTATCNGTPPAGQICAQLSFAPVSAIGLTGIQIAIEGPAGAPNNP
jgi:hypothetical protein